MNGISFEKKEFLKEFQCSSCGLFLNDKDVQEENYTFWFSDYANKITRFDTGAYSANFWLKGVDHLECQS